MTRNKHKSLPRRAIGFFRVDDYGRHQDDMPTYVITVDKTDCYTADILTARAWGAKHVSSNLKTGFFMPHVRAGDYKKSMNNLQISLLAQLKRLRTIDY